MYNFIKVNLIVFYLTNLMEKDVPDDIISDTGRNTVFERKLFERGLLADMPIKSLCERCPNTDQKKLRIWTLFTQW